MCTSAIVVLYTKPIFSASLNVYKCISPARHPRIVTNKNTIEIYKHATLIMSRYVKYAPKCATGDRMVLMISSLEMMNSNSTNGSYPNKNIARQKYKNKNTTTTVLAAKPQPVPFSSSTLHHSPEYIQFEIDTRKPIRTNMSHMRAHRPQFQFPDVHPAIRHGQAG